MTSGVTAISVGLYHSCAVVSGGAKCWGYNIHGEVGDNSTTNRLVPTQVNNLTSGVSAIGSGFFHTCVLTTGGGVKCWGYNIYGQIGNNSTNNALTPAQVSGLTSGVAQLGVGGYHACARMTDGTLKCWGYSGHGQMGDGSNGTHSIPEAVPDLSNVYSLTSGGFHTCVLLNDGGKQCWGLDFYGQLGDGQVSYVPLPGNVVESSTAYAYEDTDHPYAVTDLSNDDSYSYDANGNMTSRTEDNVTYTQVFDAENRLVSVTVNNETTEFLYNGDGQMVKKTNPDDSYVLYIGSIYEVEKTSGGSIVQSTVYYPAGGAVRVKVGAVETLYYVLGDQLGSASLTLSSAGSYVAARRYYPFGELRYSDGTMPTDKLFTGQRAMADLGIYFYNARFYSSYLNRWIQPDTIVPDLNDTQSFDRYSYVENNPILYSDPTGHWACIGLFGGGGCGGAGGGNISQQTVQEYQQVVEENPSVGENITLQQFAIGKVDDTLFSLFPGMGEQNQQNNTDQWRWTRTYQESTHQPYAGNPFFFVEPKEENSGNGLSGGIYAWGLLGAAVIQAQDSESEPYVLQTGRKTLNNNTLRVLGLTKGQGKAAIEALKHDLGLRHDYHGIIMSDGTIIDPRSGQMIGNLLDYTP